MGSAIANGLSLEAALASEPTASYDPMGGQSFLSPEQFQTIVYQSFVE